MTTRPRLAEDERLFRREYLLMRIRSLIALLVLTLLAISLAGALARSQTAPPAQRAEEARKPAEKAGVKSPDGKEGPKIVRWVCNDRICGGCDGGCSRHGHVATHRGGHCACTPDQGGALDEAIRKAFEGHEKGR